MTPRSVYTRFNLHAFAHLQTLSSQLTLSSPGEHRECGKHNIDRPAETDMHEQRAHSHQRGKCVDKCGLVHAHISGKLCTKPAAGYLQNAALYSRTQSTQVF